jgi:PAS domain S-box-containing protein
MEKILGFILLFLSQFAGGPGPVENNLVRFGLPAVLWAILLYITWSRQRYQDLPREKLLVWGFGLALVRELYMFGQMAYRLLGTGNVEATCEVIQPLEHGLAMIAMIVVAGAFLHYILEDPAITRRYLQIGIGITLVGFILSMWAWPRQFAANPQIKFHQTWAAWFFHVPLSILMCVAVALLWRKRGWLRNIIATALTFYLFSEILLLLNYATARAYNDVICPIGNSFHILAIPLFGYVYLHEQSIEKKRAEEALIVYRDHLEELVNERTAELTTVNEQLKQEISDRTQAEDALERITHRYELILESAGEGICGIDLQGRVIFANPAAASMLGYSPAELINRPSHAVWHQTRKNESPHSLEECPIYQGYSQGLQRYGDDEYFWRRDGTGFPVRYFSNPVHKKSELAGAVVVFRDITERKRSEVEIAQRNASLATQNAVAATLSQSLEIDENLKNVLEIVRLETEMEIGLIFLVNPESEDLSLHLSTGLPSMDEVQAYAHECACQQISRQALFRKHAITASPMDLSFAKRKPCLEQAKIRTLVGVPLVSKGRAVGVMTLGTLQTGSIESHKLELLTAIGQQIGMAIENARLYQDAENWAGELARLHDASSYLLASFDFNHVYAEIARQSARLLNCQAAFVFHLNDQTGKFDIAARFGLGLDELRTWQDHPSGWSFISDLARQGRVTAIRDSSTDGRLPHDMREGLHFHAALFVPLWSSENPRDYILLLDLHAARQWSPRELELIESLANRAAVALMNVNLHHQLELAAALEERQRIAANMHDGLAQTLSLLGLRVDRMQELSENGLDPEIGDLSREIREAVTNTAAEVRRSIASLQEAPRPRDPLQHLLQDLITQLRSTDGPELRFDPGFGQALYVPSRQIDQLIPLVQEAVLNACRHAHAQTVSVRLEMVGNDIRLIVEDDGCGFDLATSRHNRDHFGLSIMQARAFRMDGQLQIDTSPGNGTRIILTWKPESQEIWGLATPQPKVRLPA